MSVETDSITALLALVDHLDEASKFASTASPNWLGLETTTLAALKGDFVSQTAAVLSEGRGSLNAILDRNYGRRLLEPTLRTWAKASASPDTIPDDEPVEKLVVRLYNRLVTSSQTVKRRNPSFGSASAGGSNVGNGSVYRCTANPEGYALEAITPETKVFRCTQDAGLGAGKHQEIFEVVAPARFPDALKIDSSGYRGTLRALTGADSILSNPAFDAYDLAATPTSVPGWSAASGAIGSLIEIDESTSPYRTYGNGVPGDQSVRFKTNGTLQQVRADFSKQFDEARPYLCQIVYNTLGTANGALAAKAGAVTFGSVADLSLVSTGWNVLRGTLGQNSWYKAIKEQSLNIELVLSGASTFTLRVAEVIVAPMTLIDGSFYAVVGATTPFLRDDYFTIADTIGTDSVLQKWLWRLFGFGSQDLEAWRMMWPPASSPTISDP